MVVVFDPHYKYSFLEFSYAKLYGADSPKLETVKNTLHGVFAEYKQALKTASNTISCGVGEIKAQVKEGIGGRGTSKIILKDFDLFDNSKSSGTPETTELKLYLEEPRAETTSSICVLEFWKSQQYRYQLLGRLAMDILCGPVSTIASKSAFSLGGRILDQYRSSMSPPSFDMYKRLAIF